MRLLPLIAAGAAAVALAVPAAAQDHWHGGHGYGHAHRGYGYNHYHHGYGYRHGGYGYRPAYGYHRGYGYGFHHRCYTTFWHGRAIRHCR